MRCPVCKTTLSLLPEQRQYETLEDHVSDPNGTPPPRDAYACPNTGCELSNAFYWGFEGSSYSTSSFSALYRKHQIDPSKPETYKNAGMDALDSISRHVSDEELKRRISDARWPRRWYIAWRRKLGNWSCELRRLGNPGAVWRDNNNLRGRALYMLGVWCMDPTGMYWYRSLEHDKIWGVRGSVAKQWTYHPYPWVRYSAKRFINERKSKTT